MVYENTKTHVSFPTPHNKPLASILPEPKLAHDEQAYQTTCFSASPKGNNFMTSKHTTPMLLCFPNKASFMIGMLTTSHASLPTQHTQPLASMLPESRFIHDHHAYQTTCFFSHPSYQNTCVPAPQMLLCFPSKASFMIDKLTRLHASLPTQHTQPLAFMLHRAGQS